MQTLGQAYSDLRFSPDQLYFSDDEYNSIATEFFGNAGPETLTNRDRAFLQAALFVAVDTSIRAAAAVRGRAAPSMSIKKLLKKLATSAAKTAFKDYIDNDPKYSAVGRAGVQYSAFATEWRLRVALDDPGSLTNFLKYGQ